MITAPQWLKKRIIVNEAFFDTRKVLSDLSINTVCESSRCPNLGECFSRNFVTFMILGKVCTRACSFCSVRRGGIEPVDIKEPDRIADCVKRLNLKYVIVTSVTRDDLDDGGAAQFIKTVDCVRRSSQHVTLELLIPDFIGNKNAVKSIALCGADIIGHNIETAQRLYPFVRKDADYLRSLGILKFIKDANPKVFTKSAILAGLGEGEEEVMGTMRDLREAGCDILTIGQYLRPSQDNHPIDRFVTPEEFTKYKRIGEEMGFTSVSSGPFVRSSYRAEDNYKEQYDKYYTAAVS